MNNRDSHEEKELKHLEAISNNLKFFFWLTVISITSTFCAVLYALQNGY